MKTKTLGSVQIKDESQGTVSAVFSTLGVVDSDGDVTVKGAFTDGAHVVISAYGHKSWDGELPVGKGTIREDGDTAVLDGEFFLNTTHGRDAFETVKALSESGLQEWSYSLEEVESERGKVDGKSVNIISKVTVKEVSPVLRGAGVDTRTLVAKSRKQLTSTVARLLGDAGSARWGGGYDHYVYVYLDDFDLDDGTAVFCVVDYDGATRVRSYIQVDFTRTDTAVELGETETEVEYTTVYLPKGSKFSEHADLTLRGVKSLVEMAVERLTLRAAEGKSTSEQSDALDQLLAEVEPLRKALDDVTQPPPADESLLQELELIAIKNGITA